LILFEMSATVQYTR